MTEKKTPTISSEASKIINFLKAHPEQKFTLGQITEALGIPNKSGYLTSVRKHLGQDFKTYENDAEIVVSVKKKVNTYSYLDYNDEFEGDEEPTDFDAEVADSDLE